MMHVSPSEAKALTWWEYQALLWNWNDRHTPEEEKPVEAPSQDYVMRRQAKLERMGMKVLH